MLELYHNETSTSSQKVRLVLAEKRLDWESQHLDLWKGDQHVASYLALNPRGVVPTLVDDGTVIVESTVIMEYLDDAYPDHPLRPAAAAERARMRWWSRQLDEGVHAATSTVSGAVAFRFQHLDHKSPDELEAHLMRTADPARRARQRKKILKGMETPLFAEALNRFDRLFSGMEIALGESPWLTGASYSLADAALTPTLTRFDHLQFLGVLDHRPGLADWYARVVNRPSYDAAINEWLSESDIPLMDEKGSAAWPKIAQPLGPH